MEGPMIAADLMTENPRTIRSSDSVGEALEALQSMQIRHLPVVDAEGNLVGMLSDRDLGPLMRTYAEVSQAEPSVVPFSLRRVAELMSSDVVSVEMDADLREVIDTLLEERVGAVPVLDGDGDIAGIISYVDILRAIAAEGEARAGQRARSAEGGST
jgi:acetoin utilization protein AcuB